MKIRIKGNAIRLRLTRTEVEQFGKEGYLEERTEFVNSVFVYALCSSKNDKALSATFADSKISMSVPDAIAKEWVDSNKVGYSGEMEIAGGKFLSLLLEKDFKCVDSDRQEDQSDNYEHPLLHCK